MPDPSDFDFDATRRALDEVPAPDLWAEAERRADGGALVPLVADTERVRRPVRWLAAAAVAALVAGTVGVLASDDDEGKVDAGPGTGDGPATCTISGLEDTEPGPSPELTMVADPEVGITVHSTLDTTQLPFEVSTPAVTELTPPGVGNGIDAESVGLDRGPAVLFVAALVTQIQYDPEGDDPCTSFSVTVLGNNSKELAVDIANQVVLTARRGEPTIVGSDPCSFAFSDDSSALFTAGPADPPLFDQSVQPHEQTIVHATLGSDQVAEIHIPGLFVIDLVGERVEQVELKRGTADVWFGPDFVQVRWFTGSQALCDSFTVTVAGGTEDGNRHAAVDLADRILLASELAGMNLRDTEWQLERSTVADVPTEGGGSTFTFGDDDVQWTDGCNEFSATFSPMYPNVLDVRDIERTQADCPPNPTSEAIGSVMGSGRISITYDGDLLVLTADDVVLTLRPVEGSGESDFDPDAGFAIWPVTEAVAVPKGSVGAMTSGAAVLAFANEVLGWEDAVVVEDQSEPSEDGREDGAVHQITSSSTGGTVTVWAAPARPGGPYVVYHVDTPGREADPDSTASVEVLDGIAQGGARPELAGTTRTRVRFTYGDDVIEGAPQEEMPVPSDARPGAILVIWEGADGVIGAWGTVLPRGNFAAG